jgi:hypothetical protein
MKKTLLLLVASLFSIASFAQNGFYLAPSVGAGIGNAHQDFFASQFGVKSLPHTILTYSAGINFGYKRGHWRLETGAQYSISGYKYTGLFLDTLKLGNSTTRYKHVSIPVNVGYEVRVANKLKVVPYLGITGSYNLGASTANNIPGISESSYTWSRENYDYSHRRLSVWANAACHVEYNCTKKLSLFAGPSVQYMITNLLKDPASTPSPYNASQRNYNIHFDIGVMVNL